MTKRRVAILGGRGMLGSMLLDVLWRVPGWEVWTTVRPEVDPARYRGPAGIEIRPLDATTCSDLELQTVVAGADHVINAIGLIKQRIDEGDPAAVGTAVHTNAVFPAQLARVCSRARARMLQIATDCVFSGARGDYTEEARHDATDVYGKTKSLGETRYRSACHLRCSIVGLEQGPPRSLLGWFLSHPRGAVVRGFENHRWNGITTLHFARLCRGVIEHRLSLPALQHVVPADRVTKRRLLELFRVHFGRTDLVIEPVRVPESIDRTLSTLHPDVNRELWLRAGYEAPPTIETMIAELAAWTGKGLSNNA